MIGNVPWSDDRIKQVRALAAEGKTAAEVAEAIGGTTRNAVLGMAKRKGIVFPPKGRNGQPPAPKPEGLKDKPIVTALDRFAELISNGVTVARAGHKVYGHSFGGKIAMMQLEAKFGWGAE